MAIARTWSVALVGVQGHLVEVEADIAQGIPCLSLIGLPDTALQEARDRVRAAIVNSGEKWPQHRITVGLSPASLRKSGSGYDLALAVAILGAAGVLPIEALAGVVVLGELGLDGRVRVVRGVLPSVIAAARAGRDRVIVPDGNAAEAALVPGVDVRSVSSLAQLLRLLRGTPTDDDMSGPSAGSASEELAAEDVAGARLDLADIYGQSDGRRALEIAAAGGHHLFLLGPPGAGKTMLAERLPTILPQLDDAESLEVTAIHSVAGALLTRCPLVTAAPFRNPHHTASVAAIVGGGSGLARPGEVSLAHRGVLFLDEAPEFARVSLDALRQPLEAGEIRIARAGGTAVYPARFLLVMAANPCPCAASGTNARLCSCAPNARRRYLARLSGPLIDRIDLRVDLPAVSRADLFGDRAGVESSETVAGRVRAARGRARLRLARTPWTTNAQVPGPELRQQWPVARGALGSVDRALHSGSLTARGLERVLRVSWTIADLRGAPAPERADVDEALNLRQAAA